MGDNSFTKTYVDGASLDEGDLDPAYKSVDLHIDRTTGISADGTTGQFLKSQGAGSACTMDDVPDEKGPLTARNYGLTAVDSTNALLISLKTQALADPSSDKVKLSFSAQNASATTHVDRTVSAALSFTVTASGSLGITGTSAARVFVYGLDNAGTVVLGVSARSDFDNGDPLTTVLMSASSDNADTLYATAALTVVPRLIGYVTAALNSDSQWQTPTEVVVANNSFVTDGETAKAIRAAGNNTAVSGSSGGAFQTTSTTFVTILNSSISITTAGGAVRLQLIGDGSGVANLVRVADTTGTGASARIGFFKDGVELTQLTFGTQDVGTGASRAEILVPPSTFSHVDFTSAGTFVYDARAEIVVGASFIDVLRTKLIAYEI